MSSFALEVLTPERSLFAGPAEGLVLRAGDGDMTVLDGHTSLVSSVQPCDVRIDQPEGAALHVAVHGGFLQVDTAPGAAAGIPGVEAGEGPLAGFSTRVTLLAGVAERSDEIDVERARRALAEAEAALSELPGPAGEGGAEELVAERSRLEATVRRAELRLAVAGAARA